MSSRDGVPLSLTLEEIRAVARDVKEDLQRQANQGIRKKDWEQGVGALASMEAVDTFVYNCAMRAGEFRVREGEDAPLFRRRKKKADNVTELRKAAGE